MAAKYLLRFELDNSRGYFYGPWKAETGDVKTFNANGTCIITPRCGATFTPVHYLLIENKGFMDPTILRCSGDSFRVKVGEFDGKEIRAWMRPTAVGDVIESKDHSICNEKMTGEFIFKGYGGTLYLVPVLKSV